jgi:hypothetical protein
MVEYLSSVSLHSLVDGHKERAGRSQQRDVSVVKEHRTALDYPTSTLQQIKLDKGRLTTL